MMFYRRTSCNFDELKTPPDSKPVEPSKSSSAQPGLRKPRSFFTSKPSEASDEPVLKKQKTVETVEPSKASDEPVLKKQKSVATLEPSKASNRSKEPEYNPVVPSMSSTSASSKAAGGFKASRLQDLASQA